MSEIKKNVQSIFDLCNASGNPALVFIATKDENIDVHTNASLSLQAFIIAGYLDNNPDLNQEFIKVLEAKTRQKLQELENEPPSSH